ncbi:hypothetical protein MPER_05984, partial [Moniliophthora perniciosa FA553]
MSLNCVQLAHSVNQTSFRITNFSQDSRRLREEHIAIDAPTPCKKRLAQIPAEGLQDEEQLDDSDMPGFMDGIHESSMFACGLDDCGGLEDATEDAGSGARRRYDSSDNPFLEFKDNVRVFLDEMMLLEGRLGWDGRFLNQYFGKGRLGFSWA